jgi:ADP-dependent NAD(P)H-hydrate dehydratase / NAD(P)H-hydrate epimerase
MSIRAPAPILTAAEMRLAEERAPGLSVSDLMDRAGDAVAQAAMRYGGGRPVLILCGPGNNGGDGYVAATRLKATGLDVAVAALSPPKTDLAKAAAAKWDGAVSSLADAESRPVLVDALFGTGLSRPLDPDVGQTLHRLAKSASLSIAVDLPSGVETDSGENLGAAPVTMTLALGALKPAHLLQPSAGLCGEVRCADLGIQAASALHMVQRPKIETPGPADSKYSRGLVTVIAGEMAGAAQLAALAAQRAGAGYTVLANAHGKAPPSLALVERDIDTALADDRGRAIVIGPGLGRGAAARALLERAMASMQALVIDADALRLLSSDDFQALAKRPAPVVLTPHAGEFDALFGRSDASKLIRAQAAARDTGCKIIFKGADTIIASNDGRTMIAPAAPAWLASAGTGDVLAGIVAALLAQGKGGYAAAASAVWLHGEAARRAGPALIADDLCRHLPGAIAVCL